MGEVVQQQESKHNEEMPSPQRPSRRVMRGVGVLLIILSFSAAWLLVVGYLGWQSGQQLREQQQAEALSDLISRQISLAENDVSQGSYTLARRRLTWVLEQDPTNAAAQTLLEQVETELATTLSPTPLAVGNATAVPADPTATPGPIDNPEDEIQRIRRLIALKNWEEALPAVLAFQRAYPEYERRETDQHLYDVYINLGLDLLEGDDVELGMYYLAQAKQLGDLPQTVRDYQTWAELYLQGISFFGANYDAAAYYFRELCLSAPFYQNACDRLIESLIALGDQYAGAQDWCPAQQAYREALTQGGNGNLNDKLDQAEEGCQNATPTPLAPTNGITETETITNSFQLIDPTPLPMTPVP